MDKVQRVALFKRYRKVFKRNFVPRNSAASNRQQAVSCILGQQKKITCFKKNVSVHHLNTAILLTRDFIRINPDQKIQKKIEKLRQETAVYEVFEHSSTFIPPLDLEDSQFVHLNTLIDSEVTAFLTTLLKNYLLALAINKKHLFKNGNIGKFMRIQFSACRLMNTLLFL